MKFFQNSNIDFMKYRKLYFLVSLSLIVIGVVAFFLRGEALFGIDFTGGTLLRYEFQKPVNMEDVRTALEEGGIEKSIIQSYDRGRGVLVRTTGERWREINEIIESNFSLFSPQVVEETMVGPVIGELLKRKALFAIFFAMIGIFIYMAWRFEFRFGIAAIVCLIHDVLFTLGVFAIMGREISLPVIAAFLTITGYSLNDTIVVFDRIRENLKLSGKRELYSVINDSINQTLSRTIVTFLTTFLAVLALLLFGGVVIRDFALAMAVGIVAGTYSTIYIASPLFAEMKRRQRVRA